MDKPLAALAGSDREFWYTESVDLADFIERAERERPETVDASELAGLTPNPWVWRTGSGKTSQIRMRLGSGKLRYVRQPGESVWRRVEWTPEFDIGSNDPAIKR